MTALTRCDVPTDLVVAMQTADMLAKSDLLPNHLRGKPANVMAIGIAARAVDVPWWQAIQSMQVINGKVGMSADLHRALILRQGHTFRVVESTSLSATVEGVRKDDKDGYVHRATFTIDDAATAGLISNGGNYKKYPKAMLIARATTLLARNAFSDVIAGMAYTPEELGAQVDEEGRVLVIENEPPVPAAQIEAPVEVDPVMLLKRDVWLAAQKAGITTVEEMAEHYAKSSGGLILADATVEDLERYFAVLEDLLTVTA